MSQAIGASSHQQLTGATKVSDDVSGECLPNTPERTNCDAPPAGDSFDSTINTFAIQLHRSLKLRDVLASAVNGLRPVIGCERVSYLERRGRRYRLIAVSGYPGCPARSRQTLILERLITKVASVRRRFLFPDDDITLPDDLNRSLGEYWETSGGQFILVEPVYSTYCDPDKELSETRCESPVGALVIEQFGSCELLSDGIERLDHAVPHVTNALANSKRFSRLSILPGLLQFGLIYELIHRTKIAAVTFYGLILAGAGAALLNVQLPLEMECHGHLMPITRREVFAPVDGEVIDVEVRESDQVREGDLVARLRSLELEKSIIEQTGLLKGKFKSRDAVRAELLSRNASHLRTQTARDQTQLEVVNAEIETIEAQLQVLREQEKQLELTAPIGGTITTERLKEKLQGRPVRRGEPLMEIMDESGPWQLELAVTERRIGHILLRFREHPDIQVRFRLRSGDRDEYQCQVTRVADRTVALTESESYSIIYCDVTNIDLARRQVGSEVTARIDCGTRSLAFVWFHEFVELLYRRWWL